MQASLSRFVLFWVMLATLVAWAVGVWGAWVPARAMGLTVLGVDMPEAVKFLPGVRSGQVRLWREAFLLPQVVLSLALAVHAWQPRWPLPVWARGGMQLLALMVALSMLPPAWSPASLRAPEWRLQVLFILGCAAAAALSPVWRFLPAVVGDLLLAALGFVAGGLIAAYLNLVWPEFAAVYNAALPFGVGVWGMGAGVTGLLVLAGAHFRR